MGLYRLTNDPLRSLPDEALNRCRSVENGSWTREARAAGAGRARRFDFAIPLRQTVH